MIGRAVRSCFRLQTAWDADGQDAFVFELLDTLEPNDDPDYDPREALQTLEDLGAEKLALSSELTY